MEFDYVFVVLVYKNTEVLKDFFRFLSIPKSKVIVVNSYFDNKSLVECETIAENNCADFISVENKGYGAGNNIGIEYARKNYQFRFLIVSNSDVIIKDISALKLIKEKDIVIAPETRMLNGKGQNPDTPWELKFIYYPTFVALNKGIQWLYTATHVFTRLSRELFIFYTKIVRKEKYRIFSAHGSFIIFTYGAVNKLVPIFDDRMFLYNEEWFLAKRAQLFNIPVYYCPDIKILHLEGASSDRSDSFFFTQNRESFNILYEWIKTNSI